MSKFKAGDRVKIITGAFIGEEAIVVYNTGGVHCFNVKLKNNPDNIPERAYSEYELELIPEQKPKTKTVRKYASIIFDKDGNIKETSGFYTEEQLKKVETDYFNGEKIYHIIPTIFEDVEVPIETETRWTFICKGSRNYYPSHTKYASLEQAKRHSLGEAIAKIDDSAEEFEIE
jgi:hypothetical protein